MKKHLKIVLFLTVGGFMICLLLFLSYIKASREHDKQMMKVTHIDLYFGEKINSLESVTIKICDSIYTYKTAQVADTICQNIGISDKIFPCEVSFDYTYTTGKVKKITTQTFDCAGCSGTNTYKLKASTVAYSYRN